MDAMGYRNALFSIIDYIDNSPASTNSGITKNQSWGIFINALSELIDDGKTFVPLAISRNIDSEFGALIALCTK